MILDAYGFIKAGEMREQFAYWRNHYELQEFMADLWATKMAERDLGDKFIGALDGDEPTEFNCVELEITDEDLDDLEQAMFEFSYEDKSHKEDDEKFIKDARKYIKQGETVVYDSWW
jgi:hypothetical protein